MKNSKVFYLIYLISFFYYYHNNCYAGARVQEMEEEQFLSWIDNNDEIEENNRITLLGFLKVVLDRATINESSSIIHILAGNSHYKEEHEEDTSSNRLAFLDIMPNGIQIKMKIFSDLNKIADLAKVGNTRGIVSLLDILPREDHIEEEHIKLPRVFLPDRKDILIKFFKRMDNDMTRNTLQHLFNVYEAVNDDNLMRANGSLRRLVTHSSALYDIESSLLNLKDFGAGYRSFNIWLNEMDTLLDTLNLRNKPRISELLSYVTEANVSYFKPKTNILVGSLFYSSRTEDEIDGALLCNGQHINTNRYPYFVKTYLKTRKISTVPIAEWDRRKQELDNVGSFGYDNDSSYFIVPYIPAGTFISNPVGSITIGTTQITPKQGDYVKDQIVNMKGEFFFLDQGTLPIWTEDSVSGIFDIKRDVARTTPHVESTGGWLHGYRGVTLDSSRVVQTGDRVIPRTVFENLYVIVSE